MDTERLAAGLRESLEDVAIRRRVPSILEQLECDHYAHTYLLGHWRLCQTTLVGYVFVEDTSSVGTGVAFQPPLTEHEAPVGGTAAQPGE